MDEVLKTFNAALVLIIPGVVSALGYWLVSFIRAHTTASAVRQATDMAGATPEATQLAADELHRMPWLMRPGNVGKAVDKAVEKERVLRASLLPLPIGGEDGE